jgi:hypothetical protein
MELFAVHVVAKALEVDPEGVSDVDLLEIEVLRGPAGRTGHWGATIASPAGPTAKNTV